jgi:lysozyme
MQINDAGLDIIKLFEGFRAEPYLCPANVWTIGYGTTQYQDGARVSENDPSITEEDAVALLLESATKFGRVIEGLTPVDLTENQFSALVSFSYNVGTGNYRASTLRSKLLRQEYNEAADEFPKWCRAGGRILPGLVRRRAAERALFTG